MKNLIMTILILFSVPIFSQTNGSITHDNIERTYTYFVPTTSSSDPMPLVLVLHGTTQSGDDMIDITEFNDLAEANDFIVVYPDGIGNVWNVGIELAGSTADDLGFLEALVDLFIQDMNADPTRVFSCGFSAGGYMSHRLACESSTCFAAIASVAGTMVEDIQNNCAPTFNTSIMQIHGTSDFIVPYGGSAQSGIGVDDLISYWNNTYNCSDAAAISPLPNTNVFDFSSVERFDFSPCVEGNELVLLKVTGGGHMWPGTSVLLSGIGAINQDISASEEIWNFFTEFSCPISHAEETLASGEIKLLSNCITSSITLSGITSQSMTYTLYNSFGQVVQSGRTSGTIDCIALRTGMYFLRVGEGVWKVEKV